MKLFYVEFNRGCALVKARRLTSAIKWASAEWGNDSAPYKVREATDFDKAWVQSMGGAVHEA